MEGRKAGTCPHGPQNYVWKLHLFHGILSLSSYIYMKISFSKGGFKDE